MPTNHTFEDVWVALANARGWLTRAQGQLLWDIVLTLPESPRIVEIGSFEGRSTVVIGTAAAQLGGQVIAIDPFVDDWKFGDPDTRRRFGENIGQNGLDEIVTVIEDYSTAVRPTWSAPLDLLYIDGKHDVLTVRDDLRWVAHVNPGRPVLIHDAFSSVGVTLAILAIVLTGRSLRYERRVGSLALFHAQRPTVADRLRILGEMPWWFRNLVIKVLLRSRQQRLLARLGHTSTFDPY